MRVFAALVQSECLLVDPNSVREFAGKLSAMSIPIDILVLNAGLSLSTGAKPPPPRTKEVCTRATRAESLGLSLFPLLPKASVIPAPGRYASSHPPKP